jgi:hypothetical protein
MPIRHHKSDLLFDLPQESPKETEAVLDNVQRTIDHQPDDCTLIGQSTKYNLLQRSTTTVHPFR